MIRLALLALLAAWIVPATAGQARAEDGILTGTLKTVHDRGTILIGTRDSAIPFSFLNRAHQPVGFSIDLCHGIAEDVARALNSDLLEPDAPAWQKGVRIVTVPVAADERLPKLVSGAIDLECGSTTANADRAKIVAFSPIFFLAVGLVLALFSAGYVSMARQIRNSGAFYAFIRFGLGRPLGPRMEQHLAGLARPANRFPLDVVEMAHLVRQVIAA